MPSHSELSKILFQADPMGTCCRENGALDEYDHVAHDLVERLKDGETADVALHEVLREWFGDDLVERADLSNVIEALDHPRSRTGDSP